MQTKAMQGFTLIELMITVAIIGILAATGLPAYQNYTARAKLSEVILAASNCRATVAEIVQTESALPGAGGWNCETRTGAPPLTAYVVKIETSAEGAIRVTIRNINSDVNNHAIVIRPWPDTLRSGPVTGGGAIRVWDCGPDPANSRDISSSLPSSCRSGPNDIGTLTGFSTAS